MKLLVVSESLLELIDGQYYGIDPWIRLPQQLAAHADVTLWAPVRTGHGTPHADSWRVHVGGLCIEPHDPYHSFAGYYRMWPRRVLAWRRGARQLIAAHDAVIIRLPSPSVMLITRTASRVGKPLVFIVAGDMLAASDRIMASRGLKRVMYSCLTRILVEQERWCGHQAAIVYAYNQELSDRHRANDRPVKRLRTPHVSLRDITYRDDTCRSKEIRILHVSWLLPIKGIEYLLESIAMLKARGRHVRLEVVGKERVAGYSETLRERARQLGIGGIVTFSGWVPFDRMWEVYMRSDLQVISSLAEGTPRCIDEGAAHGLPLVSTTAGGCADVLEDERTALLVPAADPAAMAAAVERVIDGSELRRAMIARGYELARAGTFEVAGQQLLDDLHALLRGR